MAFEKSFEDAAGNTFSYWRVWPEVSIDFAARAARASLVVYVSGTTRAAEYRFNHFPDMVPRDDLQSVQDALLLEGADFETALGTGDLRAAFYTRLKALTAFEGAEDC